MRIILYMVLLVGLTGCATTTETHPTRVSSADLWWGSDRLDAYLESRRGELQKLQGQASQLESRLYEREQELAKLNMRLKQETAKTAEAENKQRLVEQEVRAKQSQLNDIQTEVSGLKRKMSQLEVRLSNAEEKNKQRIKERIAEYEVAIEDLEGEVIVLERSIDRILLVRAKHAMESE